MKKGSEMNNKVNDLIQEFEKFIFDENELVSKSPTRAADQRRDPKPYGRSRNMRSRFAGGITEVVEMETPSHCDQQGTTQFFQPPQPMLPQPQHEEVGIRDVDEWLNLCSRNPQAIKDFIANIDKDFDTKDVQLPTTPVSTTQRCKSDGMSICSTTSSQISSPTQSLSEYNVASPESFCYEESVLSNYIPANIPQPDSMYLKPQTKKSEKTFSSRAFREQETVPKYTDRYSASGDMVIVNNPPAVPTGPSSESATPNIGTLMLKLATDTYENTIDLSQFASAIRPEPEPIYNAIERDSFNRMLDPKVKRLAWMRISQLDADSLGKGDKEGDTQLMILLVSEKVSLEYVYVVVERLLQENPAYLSSRNQMNQDAVYLSALVSAREPFVTSYIAEALIRGKQDVNKQYNNGNTILHYLAMRGDACANILERLLRLKTHDDVPAFDVNRKNNKGYTPLHAACEVHKPHLGVQTYETVRILLANGADCTEKDYMEENTPIHIVINESCDMELLKILLGSSCKLQRKDSSLPTVIPNRQGNTVLHLACKRNSLDLHVQKEVVEILLQFGAMIHLKNMNGCVPSVLVASSRKKEIKSSLHSCCNK